MPLGLDPNIHADFPFLTMSYPVQYAEEGDARALARINLLSFESQGLLQQIFYEADSAALELHKANNCIKHLTNRQMHVLKVADPHTGEVVGYARWQLPEALWPRDEIPVLSQEGQEIAQDIMRLAPRPMNEALFTAFRSLLEQCRKKYLAENDIGEWAPCSPVVTSPLPLRERM